MTGGRCTRPISGYVAKFPKAAVQSACSNMVASVLALEK